MFDGLKKNDLELGHQKSLLFGKGRFGSEPAFAPRVNWQTEDDGYLISFVTDMMEDRSECIVVDAADIKCREIISKNIDQLHAIANALLEYETLSGDEVKASMRGESIVRPSNDDDRGEPQDGLRSSVPSSGAVKSGSDPEPEPQPGS